METYENDFLDYPVQNALTQQMRKEAAKQGDTGFMALWAGEKAHESRGKSVAELISEIISDLKDY